MSKVNELRKKAIQAVRSQKWDEAVKLYERVCGLDNTNASYRNELGDIYLKKGEIPSAIETLESAVELYMAVGLTNNAIAAHKKILRHNPGHMDSLWGLGEIRRRQNLEADAAGHFLEFLHHFETVEQRNREKFVDRCSLLMDNLPGDLQILSELEKIFESWHMSDEQARVLVLKAQLAQESGETDMVEKYVERARELMPLVESIPEYQVLRGGPQEAASSPDLADDLESLEVEDPADVADVAGIADEIDFTDLALSDDEAGEFLDLGLELDEDLEETTASQAPESLASTDEAVAEEIGSADVAVEPAMPEDAVSTETADPGTGPEEAAPMEDATEVAGVDEIILDEAAVEPLAPEEPGATAESDPTDPEEPEASPSGVDLLDEILADGDIDSTFSDSEKRQVNGIAHEVHGQIAAHVSDDDHKGQYEVGIVYLDMGLFDQAIDAFTRAADGDDHRLKALEMKGSCLTKVGRLEEALATFQEGLAIPGYPGRYYLGLLYEVGSCLEALGRLPEARDYFQRVAAVDREFLDVSERLARLDEQQPSVP